MTSLSKLLQEDFQSYYWVGLIAADGTIIKDRLKLELADVDKKHQNRFGKFIGVGDKRHSTSVQDHLIVPQIRRKFDLRPRKTYNPPRQALQPCDLSLSFILGFIDGDGSIRFQCRRNDCMLSVKNHASWLDTLTNFRNIVCELSGIDTPNPTINKCGYAEWTICNNAVIKWMKLKGKELKLPLLERKWEKVNEKRITRTEQSILNREQVMSLWLSLVTAV